MIDNNEGMQIRIKRNVAAKLNSIGNRGETYSDIISRLLLEKESLEEKEKEKFKKEYLCNKHKRPLTDNNGKCKDCYIEGGGFTIGL